MRKDFPSSMPVWEQLIASSERKRVGRKHMHKAGPGKKQKKTGVDPKTVRKMKAYSEKIKEFYSGKRDEFPQE